MTRVSLRLITTGLSAKHDVIGYQLNNDEPILIQPREGISYDYEAMKDVNGISIPKLKEVGKDREESLDNLLQALDGEVYIFYGPFINKFLALTLVEREQPNLNIELVDVYAMAKNRNLNALGVPNQKMDTLMSYSEAKDLVELADWLETFPLSERKRRL